MPHRKNEKTAGIRRYQPLFVFLGDLDYPDCVRNSERHIPCCECSSLSCRSLLLISNHKLVLHCIHNQKLLHSRCCIRRGIASLGASLGVDR